MKILEWSQFQSDGEVMLVEAGINTGHAQPKIKAEKFPQS